MKNPYTLCIKNDNTSLICINLKINVYKDIKRRLYQGGEYILTSVDHYNFWNSRMLLSTKQLKEIKEKAFKGYIDKYWISENFNVSTRTADRFIKHLQLIHANERTIKVIRGYLEGQSSKELAIEFNMGEQNVRQLLRNRGIKRRSRGNQYYANFNYFSDINTEEQAYLLGFIYADGCLTKKGTLAITVAKQDVDILLKFKFAMKAKHPIREHVAVTHVGSFDVVSFDITSPDLASDLKSAGVFQNKTHKITFPHIKRDLVKHFIRGYIDGDGYFTLDRNNRLTIGIEGTESFLSFLQEILKTELPIPANVKLTDPHGNNIKRLQLTGRIQVMTVLEWLYLDANVFLERKYKKFLDIKAKIHKF